MNVVKTVDGRTPEVVKVLLVDVKRERDYERRPKRGRTISQNEFFDLITPIDDSDSSECHWRQGLGLEPCKPIKRSVSSTLSASNTGGEGLRRSSFPTPTIADPHLVPRRLSAFLWVTDLWNSGAGSLLSLNSHPLVEEQLKGSFSGFVVTADAPRWYVHRCEITPRRGNLLPFESKLSV